MTTPATTQPKPGSLLQLEVQALALGGRAICRHEGCVIFVDHGLPGQHIEARIITAKKRFAEAELVRVITPAPDQQTPACRHFGQCGGCSWQDLPYDKQLHWKERFVADSLTRIGGLSNVPMRPIIPSPQPYHFRNKMEFAFAEAPEGVALGLRKRNSREVIDITECHLQSPLVARILKVARELASATDLPAWDEEDRSGFWRFLVIRQPGVGNQCLVQCITGPHPGSAAAGRAFGTALREALPEITGFVHSERASGAQVAYGERVLQEQGETILRESLGNMTLTLGPDAFFQTNTPATIKLYAEVASMAALTGTETVWDLYCGVGSIGLYLARKAAKVRGFELGEEAVAIARHNADMLDLPQCTFMPGDVARSLRKAKGHPDVVVTDPPRAGMAAAVVQTLLDVAPPRIIYVSCDPATQARDAKLLATSYDLAAVRPVDLFPQTPHVESVALFTRRW